VSQGSGDFFCTPIYFGCSNILYEYRRALAAHLFWIFFFFLVARHLDSTACTFWSPSRGWGGVSGMERVALFFFLSKSDSLLGA
jgi:hypothetical protein